MEAAVMVTVTEVVILIYKPESKFTASVSKSLFLNDLHQNKTQKCLSVVKLLLQNEEDDEDGDDDSHSTLPTFSIEAHSYVTYCICGLYCSPVLLHIQPVQL